MSKSQNPIPRRDPGDPLEFLTRKQVGEQYPISWRTLANLKVLGDGPPCYCKGPGSRALYLRHEVETWLMNRGRQG